MATAAGIDRSYLSGIENGTRNPTALVLIRLARALDTTAAELLHGVT